MRILIAVSLAVFLGCAPESGPHKPLGGGAEDGGVVASQSYDAVKTIFARHCAVCHPSRSGPDWLDYNQASAYARNGKLIRRVGIEKTMPPPGSSQAAAMSDDERRALVQWAKAGGPREAVNEKIGGEPPPAPEPSPREKLVRSCLHCHGAKASDPGAQPRIPVIAGQSREYLEAQLSRFKWRDRIDPTQEMNDLTIDLTDRQIKDVAEFFAAQGAGEPSLEPGPDSPIHELFQRGKKLAARDCVSCHRNPEYGGRPASPLVPSLGLQSKIYLMNQLFYFRGGGERSNPLMRELAKSLSNADIEALATYFANAL